MTAEHPLRDAASPPGTQSLRSALRAAAQELEAHQAPATLSARAMAALTPAVPANLSWRQSQRPDLATDGVWSAAQAKSSAPSALGSLAPQRWWAKPWAWPAVASLALVLLLSLALTLMLPPPRDAMAPDLALASGFVPVAGVEAWQLPDMTSPDAATPAWLVATEMPRERLGLLGLPFDPARAGESVRAELLLHGSGAVLAVRVVAQ